MNTKITLMLDENIIEKAKMFAKTKNTSLSKIIESYLQRITSDQETTKITPVVKSLSGVIDLSKDYDHKKEYTGSKGAIL